MPDKLKSTYEIHGQKVRLYERRTWIWLGTFAAPIVTEIYYMIEAPMNWPKVQVRARRGFAAMFYKPGRKGVLELDDERFNRAFRVTTQDPDFAILLLDPQIQSYMLEKTSVDWSFGEGALKLWYRGSLKKNRVQQSLARLEGMLALINKELDVYGLDEGS